MHRDKMVARILLILSVVHVAAAAPAIVRQRSLDVDEDVTAASEKRGDSGNTPQDVNPVPQMNNDQPSASGTAQRVNDPQPASGASHLHNNPPQLHDDSLTASETSSVHDPLLGPAEFRDVPYAPLSQEPGTPPTNNHLISDENMSRLKFVAAVVAITTALTGFTYWVNKDANSYVSAFFHPSSADTELSHKHSDL